jgi:hypothetical protein
MRPYVTIEISTEDAPAVYLTVDDTIYAIRGDDPVEMSPRRAAIAKALLQLAQDRIVEVEPR